MQFMKVGGALVELRVLDMSKLLSEKQFYFTLVTEIRGMPNQMYKHKVGNMKSCLRKMILDGLKILFLMIKIINELKKLMV